MYVSINAIQYWVDDYGTGEPVVLLHGFTGSSRTWDRFVKKWEKNRRVITVDLPGHGRTKSINTVHMESFCEDLCAIFDKLNVGKATLVGYSLGGRAALSFTMIHPEKVRSLVLESASPGLSESHEQLARQAKDEALANKLEQEGLASFVDFWENIPLFDSQQSLSKNQKQLIRAERLNQTEAGLATSLRGMGTGKQPSWWDQLAGLSVSILLIVGQLDEKFVNIADRMSESLKNCRLEIVPNAGHTVHVEQPEIFDTIVSDFFTNC